MIFSWIFFTILFNCFIFSSWFVIKNFSQDSLVGFLIPLLSAICSFFGLIGISFQIYKPPVTPCNAMAGQTIQWQGHIDGKSPSYWSYVTMPHESDHFCKIYDRNLYGMGIGYKLGKSYAGELEERP